VTGPLGRSLGIGHLATVAYPQLWDREGDGAVAHLRRYATLDFRDAVTQYAFDAGCLLATELTSGQLDLLWCSCTGGNHRPGWDGLTGREWMQIVRDVMAERADPDVMSRLEDAGHHPELAGRVLRAVEQFRVRETFSACEVREDIARAALAEVVRAGFPDVALRLFLAMMSAHLTPLSAMLFTELTDLARQMDLDDDIVPGLDFLVHRI
jgi:hypothetical protein